MVASFSLSSANTCRMERHAFNDGWARDTLDWGKIRSSGVRQVMCSSASMLQPCSMDQKGPGPFAALPHAERWRCGAILEQVVDPAVAVTKWGQLFP